MWEAHEGLWGPVLGLSGAAPGPPGSLVWPGVAGRVAGDDAAGDGAAGEVMAGGDAAGGSASGEVDMVAVVAVVAARKTLGARLVGGCGHAAGDGAWFTAGDERSS